jgi:predicted extracellular nuclease
VPGDAPIDQCVMTRIPLALAVLLGAALLLVPAATPAGTSTVVVGELFAGGGNSGAAYANDYVELFNRSSSPVNVTGWTLQYASAASTSWDVTPLTGTIAAGGHFLVKLASNGAVGAALPAADATGTTNLAASGGKVAVVNAATALTCGATAGSCTGAADLVGYGTATDYEGSGAAPALTSTTALVRAGSGCTDSGDNAADFAAGTPTPLNATAPTHLCGTGGGGGTGTSASGAVDVGVDIQPVLALGLDRTSISFGSVVGGATPSAVPVAATVTSTNAAGYTLVASRTAFTPADLPLGIGVGAAALTPVPVGASSPLTLASTSSPSAPGGDVVATRIGFVSALPSGVSGHYAGTVTYTVIAR